MELIQPTTLALILALLQFTALIGCVVWFAWQDAVYKRATDALAASHVARQCLRIQRLRGLMVLASLTVGFLGTLGLLWLMRDPVASSSEIAANISTAVNAPDQASVSSSASIVASTQPPRTPQDEALLSLFDPAPPTALEQVIRAYENALVGAYVLHNCHRIDRSDIGSLLAHLDQTLTSYATDVTARGETNLTLRQRIEASAAASYQAVYGRLDCDSMQVSELENQFARYLAGRP